MADAAPYVIDLQSDQLRDLPTRMVAPLAQQDDGLKAIRRLTPVVEFAGMRLVLMIHLAAAVPTNVLKEPVGSLDHRRDEIVAALDFLFTGI